jgi:hypothetical protein
MTNSPWFLIIDAYCDAHQRVMAFADELSEEQLKWRFSPGSLTIAFFLWHLGRWADHIQAAIPGMTEELSQRLPPGQQIWEAQGLAAAWGFDSSITGYAETGMDMDEAAAAQLIFPSKDILLSYVRAAFAAADSAVQAVDETQFNSYERSQSMTDGIRKQETTVGQAIISHLLHDHCHLGMMQMLHGQQKAAEQE